MHGCTGCNLKMEAGVGCNQYAGSDEDLQEVWFTWAAVTLRDVRRVRWHECKKKKKGKKKGRCSGERLAGWHADPSQIPNIAPHSPSPLMPPKQSVSLLTGTCCWHQRSAVKISSTTCDDKDGNKILQCHKKLKKKKPKSKLECWNNQTPAVFQQRFGFKMGSATKLAFWDTNWAVVCKSLCNLKV